MPLNSEKKLQQSKESVRRSWFKQQLIISRTKRRKKKKASPESQRKRNIRACRCDSSVRGSEPERDWSEANPRVR